MPTYSIAWAASTDDKLDTTGRLVVLNYKSEQIPVIHAKMEGPTNRR